MQALSRGRGKGCGEKWIWKSNRAVKWGDGLTLGVKEYSTGYAQFPLNCSSDELNAESIKIGSSEDFLRASKAQNLQRISQSFRNLNSREWQLFVLLRF
jgi:hypothetical protein